jgi:hypothetical protein
MIFTGWNSTALGANPNAQITVNSPTRLLAAWKTQYLVSVNSPYGTPIGSGWYDAESTAHASVPSEIAYTNATRRIFSDWTGDYSSASNNITLQVNEPKTVTARWNTQYLVTFKVSGLPNSTFVSLELNNGTYELSASSSHQAWVQGGTAIDPTLNETITNGFFTYKFTGWRNSTGGLMQGPLTVNAPGTYIASYTMQLSVPAIPGFPIEAILAGLILGLMIGIMKRRRAKGQMAASTRPNSLGLK